MLHRPQATTAAIQEISVRVAEQSDVPAIHAIHKAWQREALTDLGGGFLSVYYTLSELQEICAAGDLVAVTKDNAIQGFASVATAVSKSYKEMVLAWLTANKISSERTGLRYSIILADEIKGKRLAVEISQQIYSLLQMRYCCLCSSISKANDRSCEVHKQLGYLFYEEHPDYWIVLKDLSIIG